MQTDNTDMQKSGSGKNYRRAALYVLIAVAALFALLVALTPTLDVDMRQRANEASTVGNLDTILKLQRSYIASHPADGYSCEFSRLRSSAPKPSEYDPEAFLEAGEHLGYRYALACRAEPNGKVLHFALTARPIRPVEAGYKYRAFCADDSGIIRYDADGSGDNCLATGKPIAR